MAKRTAPRETLLYGKKYHRGVTPDEAGVSLVELLTAADRVDVRDKSLVVIGGEEHVRTEVVYYQKVRHAEQRPQRFVDPAAESVSRISGVLRLPPKH